MNLNDRCLFSSNSSHAFNRRFGTVINCTLSLNEQTRLHTSDELASLFDVLYCQIEQFIIKQQPQAKYCFDNETIVILLLNENDNESTNVDQSCRLAIELFRFIQHVNHVTQWSLTAIVGIDYNELFILPSDCFEGAAPDYSRWLREECVIINRIHVSSRIYSSLKDNKFYEFHSYSWPSNRTSLATVPSYFLFSTNMYEPLNHLSTSMNNSSMIDQLTRIQAQYHVEKHLGTITLTRSLRKRSLIELTRKHLHWSSLNFKDQSLCHENELRVDFQGTHRANRPNALLYLFILLILIGILLQALTVGHLTLLYLILFPGIILGLTVLVSLFLYSSQIDQLQSKLEINAKSRKFYAYFNTLICLTFSTLFLVAIQYHAIFNFKYLFTSNEPISMMNITSSQSNATGNTSNVR